MFRFTIRSLIELTAVICVGLALLRYPAKLAAVVTISATLSLLTGAIIWAINSRGRLCAFCVGLPVAGWIHVILAFTPWLEKGTVRILICTYLLEQAAPVFGNQLAPNMAIEEPLFSNAMTNYVPGSPPALYYKYMVIGQSLFTLAIGTL